MNNYKYLVNFSARYDNGKFIGYALLKNHIDQIEADIITEGHEDKDDALLQLHRKTTTTP